MWIIEVLYDGADSWIQAPLTPEFATEVDARAHAKALQRWGWADDLYRAANKPQPTQPNGVSNS